MTVTVPQEFVDIGFTGLFHTEATMDPADVEEWRTKVPCLLPQRGWMALDVQEGDPPRMVLVRTDAAAICDLFWPPFPRRR